MSLHRLQKSSKHLPNNSNKPSPSAQPMRALGAARVSAAASLKRKMPSTATLPLASAKRKQTKLDEEEHEDEDISPRTFSVHANSEREIPSVPDAEPGQSSDDDAPPEEQTSQLDSKKLHRKNKKRRKAEAPQELSSKKPVAYLKPDLAPQVYKPRDPRFESNAGEFRPQIFKQSYGFINDFKRGELKELEQQLKKTRDDEERSKLERVIQKYKTELREAQKKDNEAKLKSSLRKAAVEGAAKGKTPYFLKKADQKKLALVDQYLEMKKSGKLEKFIAKRRKKNASKDRKYMASED